MSEDARHLAQTLLTALQGKFDDVEHLQRTLEPVLAAFGLADGHADTASSWHTLTSEDKSYILRTSWPLLQRELATCIVVDWLPQLQQHDMVQTLWLPFFVPSALQGIYATAVAVSAYAVFGDIVTNKLVKNGLSSTSSMATGVPEIVRRQALETLSELVRKYDLANIFAHVRSQDTQAKWIHDWRTIVVMYLALPGKLAAQDTKTSSALPDNLNWRPTCSRASQSLIKIVQSLNTQQTIQLQAISFLLSKLIRSGFFAPIVGLASFWTTTFSNLSRLTVSEQPAESFVDRWIGIVKHLVSSDFATLSTTLLEHVQHTLGNEPNPAAVRRTATLLMRLLGPAQAGDTSVWELCVQRTLLERPGWHESMARVLVCWVKLSPGGIDSQSDPCL